jgi:hypothetical protein
VKHDTINSNIFNALAPQSEIQYFFKLIQQQVRSAVTSFYKKFPLHYKHPTQETVSSKDHRRPVNYVAATSAERILLRAGGCQQNANTTYRIFTPIIHPMVC